MTHGDRLGHSWREGSSCFPGLASDLRRHDPGRAGAARGHRRARLSRTRAGLAGHARPPLRQSRQPAATSSPPTMPKAWWCGPAPPPTTPRPIPTRSPRKTWSGSRCSPARCLARQGRPAVRRRARRRGRNLFAHLALLNALDLRLRAAEIVVTGKAHGRTLCRGRAASSRSSIASCCARRRPTRCRPSHPAQAEDQAPRRERGLRLRRRDLLAAGDGAGHDRGDGGGDAAAAMSESPDACRDMLRDRMFRSLPACMDRAACPAATSRFRRLQHDHRRHGDDTCMAPCVHWRPRGC